MWVRESSLGATADEPSFLSRLLASPFVERSVVGPVYETAERKAWTSFKMTYGWIALGAVFGLLAVNVYLARKVR